MKSLNYCILLLMFFSCIGVARGQGSESALSGIDIKDEPLTELIKALERRFGYHFYYNKAETDSLLVSVSATNRRIGEILDEAFHQTNFVYTLDAVQQEVFITKGQKLVLELPPDFFNAQDDAVEVRGEEAVAFDYFQNVENFNKAEKARIYEIGPKTRTITTGKATISGQVREASTGQPVIGASIVMENPFTGTATDQFGNYSIQLPKGPLTLKIEAIGMRDLERKVVLYSSGKMDIELLEDLVSLKEVIIRSDRDANVASTQMGLEKITLKTIKQLPAIMGEPDVLRAMVTLPGVKTVGEASTGFNVRGGSADQNLILYNDATIYNPSHLFGFFSAINSDLISEVALYKSNIPAKFGGRLSSVMDIQPKYGNKKKFAGNAGIGLLTGKISLEGPIVKDKTSFIFGGRATYSNWVLNLLKNEAFKNSKGSFYDFNLNVDHEINDKSGISFTGYFSKDEFQLRSDTLYGYNNQNATLKWKQKIGKKTYSEISGGYSMYDYDVSSEANPLSAFKLSFKISQYNFKADFNYSLNAKHTLSYGLSGINYRLSPGSYVPKGSESVVERDELQNEQGLESAVYLEDHYEVSPKLTLNIGLRYSMFHYLGSNRVYTYKAGLPVENYNRTDTSYYKKGEAIERFGGPEYRLSARYMVTDNLSLKISYNTLRQYIHMLTNSAAISPTDIWKLSDPNIDPQFGNQISFGIYKNFNSGLIEASLEAYHKNISNYLDYKEGADLIMNHEIETDVIRTKGEAYGIELMVKKLLGKLNGWISYSYSRSLLRANNPAKGEVINDGKWYPSNFDKPHDFSLVSNYKFSHRFSISFNCTYSTGRPVTIPISKYYYNQSNRVYYTERNAERLPDYFRTDISMNIEGNHKVHQLTHNSWTIGVYNLTGRKNAYSVYFVSENGAIKGYKLSIFGSAIPYVSFNIRF